MKACHNDKQANNPRQKSKSDYTLTKTLCSPSASTTLEPHIIMKQNAIFLLELSSSADLSISHQRRQSGNILPSVLENVSPPDYNGPFGPPPPFQCFQSLGVCRNYEYSFYPDTIRNHDFKESYGPSTSGQRVSTVIITM